MSEQRLSNGVKARHDGRGDPWSNMHREATGNQAYMTDIDAMMGLVGWASNTAERLFLEVVPDSYQNRLNEVRSFAIVAVFDRKRSLEYATSEANKFTRQVYTWLCRTIGSLQPEAPRFFYVIGANQPPWKMYEVDIAQPTNYKHVGDIENETDFASLWKSVGMFEARNRLVTHVMRQSRPNNGNGRA